MLYNFILEIQHDCLFSVFSQNHPKIEIQRWCNTQNDIIELKGDKNSLIRVMYNSFLNFVIVMCFP
jgi:hypothetical protein